MVYCQCIEKIKNKNGIITHYKIFDFENDTRVVTKEALKSVINAGKLTVVNLKLSVDNKLVDRSTEETANMIDKLGLKSSTAKDEKQYQKGMMLGTVPDIDSYGTIISMPSSSTVLINGKCKGVYRVFSCDGTVIFDGNSDFRMNERMNADKFIIKNPVLIKYLTEYKLVAKNGILISVADANDKLLDIIFKTIKEYGRNRDNIGGEVPIIYVDDKVMDVDRALLKMRSIIKRQKPSLNPGRRSYDLAVYVLFMKLLSISFNNNTDFLIGADKFTEEFDIQGNKVSRGDLQDYTYRYKSEYFMRAYNQLSTRGN